jgi:hypothetical protein
MPNDAKPISAHIWLLNDPKSGERWEKSHRAPAVASCSLGELVNGERPVTKS